MAIDSFSRYLKYQGGFTVVCVNTFRKPYINNYNHQLHHAKAVFKQQHLLWVHFQAYLEFVKYFILGFGFFILLSSPSSTSLQITYHLHPSSIQTRSIASSISLHSCISASAAYHLNDAEPPAILKYASYLQRLLWTQLYHRFQ